MVVTFVVMMSFPGPDGKTHFTELESRRPGFT